jgi:hypothetical protein
METSGLENGLPRLASSVTSTTGLCFQSASIFVARFSNCTRVSYRTGHRCLFLESVVADIVRAYSLVKGPIFVYIGEAASDCKDIVNDDL